MNKSIFLSLLSLALCLCLSVVFISCDDDDDPKLTVNGVPTIDANGIVNGTITVSADNTDWSVSASSDDNWLSAYKNGNQVKLDAKENTTTSERYASVVVTATKNANLSYTVKVTQKGASPYLKLNPTSISLPSGEGATGSFIIDTNLSWIASCDASWLNLSSKSGSGSTNITISTTEENTSTSPRNASIIVKEENASQSYTVNVTQAGAKIEINVSPTVELLGYINSTTTITVSASNNIAWNITGTPDWLSFNKSGLGSSTVVITATKENFSDEEREATLIFTTSDGSASAKCTVAQKGVLAANCRVTIKDMTVMSDGFAGNLQFDANCKGYREAYFFASALPSATDRDIFYTLMQEEEYSGSVDFFMSPLISPDDYPEAEIVYCIAAYGAESNPDGSHKYGPITIQRVKTKARTLSSDMYLTLSYTTSTWKVTASRSGSYGQQCNEFYRIAGDGDGAEGIYDRWLGLGYSSAFFTHFYFKPAIEKSPETYYKNGPQTMTFSRSSDKFCLVTWGVNKNTGEYSAELLGVYYPIPFYPSDPAIQYSKSRVNKLHKMTIKKNGAIHYTRKYTSKNDMPKLNLSVSK